MVKAIVTKEELGMERAPQEEARCPVCGAEINNDSFVCTLCDDEIYYLE